MVKSIASLVENQWIAEVPSNPDEYSFVHPLFYQTLYDITPAGERARLHNTIAISIEQKYPGNPSHYALLAHQYGLAKSCRPKALEYFIRAGVFSLSNGPLSFDEGLEMLVQAKLFADHSEDLTTILKIITLYHDKLMTMRTHLLEDEEKAKRKISCVSQHNPKISISQQQQSLLQQNIVLNNKKENTSGNSNNSNNTNNSNKNNNNDKNNDKNNNNNSNNNIPKINDVNESMKQSFLIPQKIINRFFNCQNKRNERRVSPFRLSNSKLPVVVSSRIVSVESTEETYKAGGCGLTIIGTNIFLKLFRQIEVDLNEFQAEMVKNGRTGTVPEWQIRLREQMNSETGILNDINSITLPPPAYSRRSRSSILVLAGGSIKMLTNTAERRSGSILDLLEQSVDPEIENPGVHEIANHVTVVNALEECHLILESDPKSTLNILNTPESVSKSQRLSPSESLADSNSKKTDSEQKCVLS